MSVFEVAISLTEASGGKVRVEVVRSPAGEALAVVQLNAARLAVQREPVQQVLLASSGQRMIPPTEQAVQQIGQELFTALLGTGEVAGRYRSAAAVAAERGERLRVVLRIDSPLLASLPWEAMYDQALGGYVCRHEQLVRHVPVPSLPAPLRVDLPLRVLGVVSSPFGLAPLDTDRERDQLERALARPVREGVVEVRWVAATWADLQTELMDGPWHVLHYIGHGDFDPRLDEGVLALEREVDGYTDPVSATRIVDLLGQADPMPRLVVLNSCSGATTGNTDLFSGTAGALVRGGISAVVAMQYAISDAAAIAFARGFYTAIARGRGVDQAVTAGRVAILGTSQDTLEWVTPVLYLRGDQTHLYTIPKAASDPLQAGDQRYRSSPISQKDDRVEIIWDPITQTRRFLVPPAVAWEWIRNLGQEESSNDER